MGMEEFRNYMNALEILSEEIEASPEFKLVAGAMNRPEMLHRFNLHRAMVNLLHFVTVHMMRADAHDYDGESERWILGALDQASREIRNGLTRPLPLEARHLAERSLNLSNQILADIHTVAA
ncbi:hypothetical protein KFF05_02250 [bacterium SCSIO 12827]|nr:hypothetical protein KFF05_02250 [bacterium SCSIO 12827]